MLRVSLRPEDKLLLQVLSMDTIWRRVNEKRK
jgi:hypothetical protein